MRLFTGRNRYWTALLVLVIAIVCLAAKCSVDGSGVRVTISKETTYITEPLRPDGYPDYVAALNEQFSHGVTPESNSAVLFWKAIGPATIPQEVREKYFKMLGIPSLPEKGDYFVTSDAHVAAQPARRANSKSPAGKELGDSLEKQFREQFWRILERPWSKQEFPVWAEWLAVNEKPLAVLVEASKRPRRYDPLISTPFGDNESAMAIGILLESVQASRDVARALLARSMLRVQEGEIDEAWQDLLACHRLARLVGQGPSLVEVLVALTIDGMARGGEHRLLEHGKLTPTQIAAMRKDLAALPPMPQVADQLDQSERLFYLDCVTTMAREGPNSLSAIIGTSFGGLAESALNVVGMTVDWDIVLRMGNAWLDRQVEASRKSTHKERKEAFDKIDVDIKKLVQSAKDLKSFGLSFVTGPHRAISEQVGRMFVGLLLPAVSAAVDAEDRSLMEAQLTDLAFALAAYRADHGSYPAKLADLVPKYVSKVPKDMFNDAELHYQREADGYLLYSVGLNGIDDGGKSHDDWMDGKQPDDLIIRMPSAEQGR